MPETNPKKQILVLVLMGAIGFVGGLFLFSLFVILSIALGILTL